MNDNDFVSEMLKEWGLEKYISTFLGVYKLLNSFLV